MNLNELLSKKFDGYDITTKTYHTIRDAGLYANLNWIIRKVCLMELYGYKVENINFILHEYIPKVSVYNSLFEKKEIITNLHEFSEQDKMNFYEKTNYSSFGLGTNLRDFNFNITNQIVSKFFTPNKFVMGWYERFLNQVGGNIKDIIFVWARKTDKTSEAKIPNIETYLKIISEIDTKNKKILIQTDDLGVLKEFENSGLNFHRLLDIPFSKKQNRPFHLNLKDISNDEFQRTYRITKMDYLGQMLALSIIGKNAYKTILYPGNPSSYISILKGSLEDCFLFKDDLNLF